MTPSEGIAVAPRDAGSRAPRMDRPLGPGMAFPTEPPVASPMTRLLKSRFLPPVLGLFSALVVWWIWGSLNAVSAVHDESAYLLQARLFADGQWFAPSPPIPEFFEQFHVLVTPVFAAKYPPGHSLLLVPGIWLGLAGLVPLALTGLAGALFFSLARRLTGPGVALVAWTLWMGAPGNLLFRSTYLSEVTTSALWLLGWWALWRWKEEGALRFLLTFSVCVGWSAITRPLTALVFALPAGILVLREALNEGRRFRQLAVAVPAGAAILVLLPLWSAKTTGDWRLSPLALYTQQYMPYDVLGFGPVREIALRAIPSDLAHLNDAMRERRAEHRLSTLPRTLAVRAGLIARDVWGERLAFALFLCFAAGVLSLRPEGAFALVTAVLLVLAYLAYYYDHAFSNERGWSVYYLEIYPVIAYVTALGLWRAFQVISRSAGRAGVPTLRSAPTAVLVTLGVLFLTGYPAVRMAPVRHAKQDWLEYRASFRRRVERLPGSTVVFVHYATGHYSHNSLVTNWAQLGSSPTWVVYDRGSDNQRLLRLIPDRTPYIYDEWRGTLLPLENVSPATSYRRVAPDEPLSAPDRYNRAP